MSDPIVRTHDDLVALIAGMRTEIEFLREALTEYAKEKNWHIGARFDPNSHRFDGISFARHTLEQKP